MPRHRSRSTPPRAPVRARAAGGSSDRLLSQASDGEIAGTAAAPVVALGFLLDPGDGAFREQIGAKVLVEHRIVPAPPLEPHRRVALLLVPVVGENPAQRLVGARRDALVVPIGGLELLDDRLDGAVLLDGRLVEPLDRLVIPLARHPSPSRTSLPPGVFPRWVCVSRP